MTARRTTTRPAAGKPKATDGDVVARLLNIIERLTDRIEAAERRLGALDGRDTRGNK